MLNFQEFARQQINEIGNQPYPVNLVKKSPRRYEFLSRIRDGKELVIYFYNMPYFEPKKWSMGFKVNDKIDITGEGDAYRIMATVVVAIEQFVKICDEPFSKLSFIAFHQNEGSPNQKTSRTDLYRAMLMRYARRGKFEFSENVNGERSIFTLYKKESNNA